MQFKLHIDKVLCRQNSLPALRKCSINDPLIVQENKCVRSSFCGYNLKINSNIGKMHVVNFK